MLTDKQIERSQRDDGRVWTEVYTGGLYWPLDPSHEDVHLEDIAHGLSKLCRYNGQCEFFYSVAQHSYWVSQFVPPEDMLWGLLHDAAEAYIGDMINPIKRFSGELGRLFSLLEKKNMKAIAKWAGLSGEIPESVEYVDSQILLVEKKALLPKSKMNWGIEKDDALHNEMTNSIPMEPWNPKEAKSKFIERFIELF